MTDFQLSMAELMKLTPTDVALMTHDSQNLLPYERETGSTKARATLAYHTMISLIKHGGTTEAILKINDEYPAFMTLNERQFNRLLEAGQWGTV